DLLRHHGVRHAGDVLIVRRTKELPDIPTDQGEYDDRDNPGRDPGCTSWRLWPVRAFTTAAFPLLTVPVLVGTHQRELWFFGILLTHTYVSFQIAIVRLRRWQWPSRIAVIHGRTTNTRVLRKL